MTRDEIERKADISDCGRYRWSLSRCWDHQLPVLGWIMLNPSTADALQDDPTIRRCIGFARAWNFGGIEVCNLFAWRATDPAELAKSIDPRGWDNDARLGSLSIRCPKIVCAWGAHPMAKRRGQRVTTMLTDNGAHCVCLGTTNKGYPKHPLYVPADAEPMVWPRPLVAPVSA